MTTDAMQDTQSRSDVLLRESGGTDSHAPSLRKLRLRVDDVLAMMDKEFDAVYAKTGRPSVPPERLLKAMLLPILLAIRSERLRVESNDYNLLYCWFVELAIDNPVWDHATFSDHRDRLFNEGLARMFFARARALADGQKLAVTPHVARKKTGSAIDSRKTLHAGNQTSLKVRKRIEEVFGWLKSVGACVRRVSSVGRSRRARHFCALPRITWCASAARRVGGMRSMSMAKSARIPPKGGKMAGKPAKLPPPTGAKQGRIKAMTLKIDRSGLGWEV